MKQNGFTLIEVVVTIGLISVMMGTGIMTISLVNNARFRSAVDQVEQAVIYAREATVTTGREHNIYCFSNRVLVRRGIEKPIYTVQLGQEVYIPDNCTGKKLYFCDSMAVARAGTIELVSKTTGRKAKITVSVATSKVRTRYIN